jgi:hypothetical protein
MSIDTSDPSEPLPDRKRERFCQELMAGAPLYDAYTEAGFARPRGNAQRMEREPEVAARLEFLRRQVEKYEPVLLAFRRVMVRRKLDNIVDLDRLGLFEEYRARGKRRLRLKSIDQLTPEQRAIIDSVEITKDGVKLAMPGKLAALAQLAKLDGLDRPTNIEHSGGLTLEALINASYQTHETTPDDTKPTAEANELHPL